MDDLITCGKCTAIASCELASSGSVSNVSSCSTVPNLEVSLSMIPIAYAGNTTCHTCEYSCDENTRHYDIPAECMASNPYFTCSSKTVGTNTCYVPSACNEDNGYYTTCPTGTGYTSSKDNTVINNGVSCSACTYSCDTNNNYSTTKPAEGREYSYITTPDNQICYTDEGCPADAPYTSEQACTSGGWNCTENIANSGCWKHTTASTCTEGTTTCPDTNGFITSSNAISGVYSGGEQCYSCSYTCDHDTGYYGNKETCEENFMGYECTSTTLSNPYGNNFTCWYKTSTTTNCPTGEYTTCPTDLTNAIVLASKTATGNYSGDMACYTCNYQCNTSRGLYETTVSCPDTNQTGFVVTNDTDIFYGLNTGIDDNLGRSCHSCTYSCDTSAGYSDTKPASGGYETISLNKTYEDQEDLTCYKSVSCAEGEYDSYEECRADGYLQCASTTASTDGCWVPALCPEGYEKRTDCSDKEHPSGWEYERLGSSTLLACGKCTAKTCNTGFTASLEAKSCPTSGVNGWTVAQDTSLPYAGDEPCNQCVAKICPTNSVVGENCPTIGGLAVDSDNTNGMSGDDYCHICQYTCDTLNSYFDSSTTCEYSEGTCQEVNISTPFGDTITCYTGTSSTSHTASVINTSTITNTSQMYLENSDAYLRYGMLSDNSPIINKGTIDISMSVPTNDGLYGMYAYSISTGAINEENASITVENTNSSNTNNTVGIYSQNNATNKGDINVKNNATSGTTTGMNANGKVINTETGNITVNSQYTARGIDLGVTGGEVHNDGNINVKSQNGTAYGITSSNLINTTYIRNTGNITVSAPNGIAIGIGTATLGNTQIENYGTITVDGQHAFGIRSYGENNIVINAGTIKATGTTRAYGIHFHDTSATNLVANTGTIIVNNAEVGNSGINLNGATLANLGDVVFEGETADLDALGGVVTLENGGTYEVKSLKGSLTAGTSLVMGENLDTYVAEDSLKVENTDELNLTSGSAMFEASVEENATTGNKNVVMTRTSFDKFTPNSSITDYLEENYTEGKLTDMYDDIKAHASASATSKEIAKDLGYDILPNFADENFTVLKSLNRNISDTILTPTDEVNRVTAGYDNINMETKDKGLLSGSELSSNTMYTFGDKRLDNKNRLGLGLSLTKISSNYETGGNRDLEVISIFMPYMHKFSDKLRLSSVLSFGMGFGEYDRGSDEYESDINDIFYGITNELRYSVDLNGFAQLEPALMLNAIGYTEDGFDEGNGADALESKKTHNLSVEAGIGLFLKKEFNTPQHGRFTMRVGGAYYRELASPYDDIVARHKHGTGAWYRIDDYADLYDKDRALLEATLNYDYKALGLYLKYNRMFQRNDPQLFDLGVKYNF